MLLAPGQPTIGTGAPPPKAAAMASAAACREDSGASNVPAFESEPSLADTHSAAAPKAGALVNAVTEVDSDAAELTAAVDSTVESSSIIRSSGNGSAPAILPAVERSFVACVFVRWQADILVREVILAVAQGRC